MIKLCSCICRWKINVLAGQKNLTNIYYGQFKKPIRICIKHGTNYYDHRVLIKYILWNLRDHWNAQLFEWWEGRYEFLTVFRPRHIVVNILSLLYCIFYMIKIIQKGDMTPSAPSVSTPYTTTILDKIICIIVLMTKRDLMVILMGASL